MSYHCDGSRKDGDQRQSHHGVPPGVAIGSKGLATAEVARRLWLSDGTVRNRVSEILSKLRARTRSECVLLARKKRLVVNGVSPDLDWASGTANAVKLLMPNEPPQRSDSTRYDLKVERDFDAPPQAVFDAY